MGINKYRQPDHATERSRSQRAKLEAAGKANVERIRARGVQSIAEAFAEQSSKGLIRVKIENGYKWVRK